MHFTRQITAVKSVRFKAATQKMDLFVGRLMINRYVIKISHLSFIIRN